MSSPWELALGERALELDPALRTYFSAVPRGSVGRGSGVFERVGTPRRALWPVLAVLARLGIAFPVWERDVPFEVVNTPADGAVRATRTFRFASGSRVMRDEIRMTADGLVDVLGVGVLLEAPLRAEVVDGALVLSSTGVRVRLGRARIPIPLAPRVLVAEQRAVEGRQRVELRMVHPLLGRMYEYAGEFDYRIEPAEGVA